MFSLIYSLLMAYAIHKGAKVESIGGIVFVLVVCDLIALNIIFN